MARNCLSPLIACTLAIVCQPSALLRAERPTAPNLLPGTTFAYLRVNDLEDVKQRFQDTSLGKIAGDERLKPLLRQLYGGLGEAFSQAQDEVGLSLDQLLSIPQGEACVAVAAGPDGRPKIIVLLDAGNQATLLRDLLDRGADMLARQGARRTVERVGDTELVVFTNMPNSDQPLTIFEKESTFVLTSDVDVAKGILAAWTSPPGDEAESGGDSESDPAAVAKAPKLLSRNPRFQTIIRRTRGNKDERPQVTFFLDPIEMARSAFKDEVGAQTMIAVLPVLGLDGLQAIGGGLVMAPEEYDLIGHIYVLLAEPRTGALELIAPQEIEIKPEPWVPASAASYMSVQWDVQKTYAKFVEIYDQFGGEGAAANRMQKGVSDRLGVDFKKELLDALDGRFTVATWMEKPARVNGQCQLFAARLKDAAAFEATLDKIVARFPNALKREDYAGVAWRRITAGNPDGPPRPPGADRPGGPAPPIRQPEGCLAILGDYLVLTDSQRFLEQAIIANRDESQSLAGDLEFKLVASKIRRQAGGSAPSLIRFSRPEETMRQFYDLAADQQVKDSIAAQAERSRVAGAVGNALRDNPLPPFEVIAQYLAPSGGFLVNDANGLHYVGFALRREAP